MRHDRTRLSHILLLVSAVSISGSFLLNAQKPAAQIHLEVKDPSGAPVDASGNLDGPGGDRPFHTDSQGTFTFDGLAGGRYRLDVSKVGFATQSSAIDVPESVVVSKTITLSLASQASRIDVIESSPLPGTDLPIDQIPGPVQTATGQDLDRSGALDLTDYMARRMDSVHINQNQENPFQPDLNYRGYTASPLLGTPEGISVYMDGVRQNQPFGDVVAWDLIPKIAISEMALIPGSNPLFGLNTLGGAVSIETKNGFSAPGTMLQISGGSFGRREGQIEHGWSNSKGLSLYVAGDLFREDGWRQLSPSEVRQVLAKVGWRNAKTSVFLSLGYADNWLTGNGLQDTRFLAQNWSSVNSVPDITWNRSPSFNLSLSHNVTSHLVLSGNAYFRYIRADTTNGDLNNDSFGESLYNLSAGDIAALNAAGYKGFPTTGNTTTMPFPFWRCIAQGLELSEPEEKCDGVIGNTHNKQNNWGLSGQLGWLIGHHRVTAGAIWDRSSTIFQQASEFAYLNSDSLTFTPTGVFEDGSTNANGVPVDNRVNLHGGVNTASFYIGDTISLGKSLAFTVSGRYNRTAIDNADRLPLVTDGSRGSLNGNYVFNRFNPAIGFTWTAPKYASVYFNYSESNRAPTSIELGCADPTQPCNLPNALVGDPPLKQVVTRTFEAGLRGSLPGIGENNLRWSAGWFRGENYNDLLFVASQQTGFGYFLNFGKTLRQGAEISVSGKFRRFTLGGNYTFLDATYQTPQVIAGSSNSLGDGGPGQDGNINIVPGDQIPQLPRNMLKAYADYQVTSKFSVDLDFNATGRSFARGNENNLDKPDGVYYLGQGFSPGYGVLNLGARYRPYKKIEIFVQIDNLLNHRYYTAAQLGPTPYDNAGNFIARPFAAPPGEDFPVRTSTFFAPGAPIGAWGGLRFRF
ncbi:MAG TPA: TonB-dependent receptor [Bryobacteraceae bacterium]